MPAPSPTTADPDAAIEERPEAAQVLIRAEKRLAETERLASRVSPADRARLASMLAGQFSALASSPLVTDDPHAQELLRDLSGAQTGEQLSQLFEPLAAYLTQKAEAQLSARVEAGDADPTALDTFRRAITGGGRHRAPTASARVSAPEENGPTEAPRLKRRTVLHL